MLILSHPPNCPVMHFLALVALTCIAFPALSQDTEGPCSSSEFRQLDFWVGEWELSWPGGQGGTPEGQTGESVNTITRELGSCVIHESFNGDGFNGQSVSIYDARSEEWKQTWVDDQGGYISFTGVIDDGVMQFRTAAFSDAQGNQRINRMIWEDITRARLTWRWQSSTDDGETWSDLWVIAYTRR